MNKHPVLFFVILGLMAFISSCILIMLKLANVINWSWFAIALPPLCIIGLEVVFCIGLMMYIVAKTILDNWHGKYITMNVYDH